MFNFSSYSFSCNFHEKLFIAEVEGLNHGKFHLSLKPHLLQWNEKKKIKPDIKCGFIEMITKVHRIFFLCGSKLSLHIHFLGFNKRMLIFSSRNIRVISLFFQLYDNNIFLFRSHVRTRVGIIYSMYENHVCSIWLSCICDNDNQTTIKSNQNSCSANVWWCGSCIFCLFGCCLLFIFIWFTDVCVCFSFWTNPFFATFPYILCNEKQNKPSDLANFLHASNTMHIFTSFNIWSNFHKCEFAHRLVASARIMPSCVIEFDVDTLNSFSRRLVNALF